MAKVMVVDDAHSELNEAAAASGRQLLPLFRKEDVVIKSLGGLLDRVGPFASAMISGAGKAGRAGARARGMGRPAARARRILLVGGSVSIRKFVGQMLENYVTKPVDEGAFVRLMVSLTARSAGLERAEARS